MRYLNKIVFINSAHVPYAEIMLDGNVHFIGTQGVGKSTLLRAILFFYNVEKNKLGIRTQFGQKSYDEFYLPYPNSYIIYEVCRETGNFFVMTFISSGRTAFRIVDCAYDKRFFVQEDGNVRYEWGRISEQIGAKVFKSNIIRGYEEFRDILYGNNQSQIIDKKLLRFSLLESPKYRQVPLTIQNIFLNQSLESRVIKDTIIDSMDFAGDDIDLNLYREEVKNFRQQYEDIWKWYKQEKNGRIKVKVEADAVIEKYTQYEYTRKIINELCTQLNYALDRDSKRLPQLAEEESNCRLELSRQNRLLGEEEGKYNVERDKLNQEDGALKAFLEQAKAKRKHYEDIGIAQIIERIGKEGELKIQKQSLQHQQETLTSKNQSIKSKYDALQQEVSNQLREYKLQSEQQLNEIGRQQMESFAHLQSELSNQQDNIRGQFQLKLDENQKQLDNANQERNDLILQEQRIKQANPYQDVMDEHDRKMKELQERSIQLYRDSSSKQMEIDRITNEVTMKRKDLEIACDKAISLLENDIKQLSAEIEEIDDMLSRQKGSLVEWLGGNVKGWEDNFGRVVDESAVLYNTMLNPQLKDASDTIYGIKIDTENIEKTVKTPDEIKARKTELERQVESLGKQIVDGKHKLDADIAELERKPSARLKQLRIEKMNADAECNQIPVRIESIKKEKTETEEKLKNWRESEIDKLQQKLGEKEKTIELISQQKRLLITQRDKDLDNVRKSYEKQKKEAANGYDQQKETVKSELAKKEQESCRRKGELQALMDAELKGMGVDVNQLAGIRRQLQAVTDELGYIENHRPDYISWQNDTRDYFSVEQKKKDERKQVQQKIDDLHEKFRKRNQSYEVKIAELSKELRSLQDEQKQLKEAIGRVRAFMNSSSCPSELLNIGEQETVKPLADILEELRDNISGQQRKMEEFKQAVINFKSNFSPQNTFHFRTEFSID